MADLLDINMLATSFRKRLDSFGASSDNWHDKYIVVCLNEAISALEEGNYGVGAALVRNEVVVKVGRNQVFSPYFRSDLHAEMSVLNAYEDEIQGSALLHQDTTLYTSVEPCLMCFARIISAGIKSVYYAVPESTGGMSGMNQNLPEAWIKIQTGSGTTFSQAPCSQELSRLASEIIWSTAEGLENKLQNRGCEKKIH